jgi:lactoylglutathione lyase
MPDIGFTHLALPVRSLDASIAFYETYAGMKVLHRRPGVGWVGDPGRSFALVLIETKTEISPLLPMAHLGVAVASEAEVDRLSKMAEQEKRLVKPPEQSGPPIGYWAFLADPDGHTLEISFGQELLLAAGGAN